MGLGAFQKVNTHTNMYIYVYISICNIPSENNDDIKRTHMRFLDET